jgi:hypothetical protein
LARGAAEYSDGLAGLVKAASGVRLRARRFAPDAGKLMPEGVFLEANFDSYAD